MDLEAGGVAGAGAVSCCGVADAVMIDAAMRCPAGRMAALAGRQSPGRQFMYHMNCCPTCPPAKSGQSCSCVHTSELQYVFGTISNYECVSLAVGLGCD